MKLRLSSLCKASAVLGAAVGLFFSIGSSQGFAQSGELKFNKWVDGGGHCPASCDSGKYDCPCAVIYPT